MPPDKGASLYSPMMLRIPLSKHSITVNYAEIRDEANIEVDHLHDCLEICYCLENTLTVRAGGSSYELSPGNFLLILRGIPHSVINNRDTKNKHFIIDFDFPNVDEHNEKDHPLAAKVDKLSSLWSAVRGDNRLDDIKLILGKMERELLDKNIGWLFLYRGHCLEFLVECIRDVIPPGNDIKHSRETNLAIEILKCIQSNYNKKMSLSEIATAMHISVRHAERVFLDYFGVNYTKMLNLYRIYHTKELLIKTKLCLDDIAELVGYSSGQILNKRFSDIEGISAREYRAAHKK